MCFPANEAMTGPYRITLCAAPCMRWGSARNTLGTGSGQAPARCWSISPYDSTKAANDIQFVAFVFEAI